jgi:ABC-2 type transport system permease protein
VIVARRLLADRRRSLVWWSIAMGGLVVFSVALYPSIEGDQRFEDLARDLPASLRAMFGFDEAVLITSAPGYLHSRLFSTFLPLLLLIFGIGLGAWTIAGSEQDGTLELLLVNPVTRQRVAVERYVASIVLLAVLGTVFFVVLLGAGAPFGALQGVSLPGAAAATAGALGLAALHTTIAFTIGAVTGRRSVALGVAGAVAVAGYVIQGLLAVGETLRPIRFLTPWHWYLGRNMLAQGIAPEAIVVPLLLSIGLFAVGVAGFARRDLR